MNIAMAHAEAKMSTYEKSQLAKAMNEKIWLQKMLFPKQKRIVRESLVTGIWSGIPQVRDFRAQEEPMQATTTFPIKCHKGLYSLRPG